MLGLIPIAILLAGAVGVTVLRFVPRGTGFSWLFSVFCSLAAWIVFLFSKAFLPYMYSGNLYSDIAINIHFPAFQVDLIIWPMIVGILAVVVGAIISSAARIGFDANSVEWAGILLFGAIGFASCASQNVLTGVIFLSLFDFFDFFIIITSRKQEKGNYLYLFWRLISLLFLFAVFSWSNLDEQSVNDWETLQSIPSQLALIAFIIRMGVSPSKSLIGIPVSVSTGLDTARHLIGFIISAAIVIQLPAFVGSEIALAILLVYLLVSLVVSLMRLKPEKTSSNPFLWQSICGALICAQYLYGFSASAIMLLIAFIPILFIYRQPFRSGKFYLVIGLLAILGFSGLPFTPNNSGLNGFRTSGAVSGVFFIVSLIPMFFHMLKTVFSENFPDTVVERWALTIAPLGSIILIISTWAVYFLWQPDAVKILFSVQSILMTLGGTGIFVADRLKLFNLEPGLGKYKDFNKNYLSGLTLKFRQVKMPSLSVIEKVYRFIINLFESDGGILWAILCLVLIITIISGIGLN